MRERERRKSVREQGFSSPTEDGCGQSEEGKYASLYGVGLVSAMATWCSTLIPMSVMTKKAKAAKARRTAARAGVDSRTLPRDQPKRWFFASRKVSSICIRLAYSRTMSAASPSESEVASSQGSRADWRSSRSSLQAGGGGLGPGRRRFRTSTRRQGIRCFTKRPNAPSSTGVVVALA